MSQSAVVVALMLLTPLAAQAQGTSAASSPRSAPQAGGAGALPRVQESAVGAIGNRRVQMVGRISMDIAASALPADGQTPVHVTVQLFDRRDEPMRTPTLVTIEHSAGRVLLNGTGTGEQGLGGSDTDRQTKGIQLQVHNGQASFQLQAPQEPQEVAIRLTAGDATLEHKLEYVPAQRGQVATSALHARALADAGGAGTAPRIAQTAVGAVDYRNNKAVGRISMGIAASALPADGQTPVRVTVHLFDRRDELLRTPAFVTIEHSAGRVLLNGAGTDEQGLGGRDADRRTPGIQLQVQNGQASFQLLAPHEPQEVVIRLTAGEATLEGKVDYVPELREMVATGLIEGVISLRKGPTGANGLRVENVSRGDPFEEEMRRWERSFSNGRGHVGAHAAFFLRGVVSGNTLLTAAYDSEKEVRARMLRDIRPEEFYPVYGDASLRGSDARSASRLYVRLDQGRHYVMYGNFETGSGFSQRAGGGSVASVQQRALGQYNRSATGLRAHFEGEHGHVNVFGTRDSLRQVVEEFSSQGSGPYGLANQAVLEGSAKVEMVVRDRNQPARIVRSTPLSFGVDFTYEPFSGRILLNQALPAFDSELNPISLRVSYEVDQGGQSFTVAGVDAQLKLGKVLTLGGNFVNDTNPLAPYRLASAHAVLEASPNTKLVVEAAQSRTEVNTNPGNVATAANLASQVGTVQGSAWRVEGVHESGGLKLRASAGRSEPTFHNPAAPLQGGRGEAQAKVSYALTEGITAFAEGLKSEDRNAGGGTRRAAQLGANWKPSQDFAVEIALRAVRESDGTVQPNWPTPFTSTAGLTGSVATGAGGGAVGYGQQLIDPATGVAVINPGAGIPTTGGTANASALSTQTVRLGVGWRVSERVSVGGEVEHEVEGERHRRASLGADVQVAERTRLYGRYEHRTGYTSPFALTAGTPAAGDRQAHSLAFGVDSSYWRGTQAFSEYRLRDAISGRDLQWANGLRNQWDVSEGLRIHTSAERVNHLQGASPSTWAIAVGADYSAHPLWRLGGRVELRQSDDVQGTAINERFNTTLWQLSVARKLDRDWTALGRHHSLHTRYAAKGGVNQDRTQVGLAYRDTDTNRVNALARYEWRTERDASGADLLGFLSHLISGHIDYHPSRPWWFSGRAAGLIRKDQVEGGVNDNFKGVLLSGRATWDFSENWDFGVMVATMAGQRGVRQTAWGLEAGYLLAQNLWLSVGANGAGFTADPQLQGYEYTRQGAYMRLRFKFDEDWFKGDSPAVNRSLQR